MNKTPALIVATFDAVWRAYGTLADSAGHLPVRDRYHRLWVLVEVAERLRSRRAFARDSPHVNDSPNIHGLTDADPLAVLSAHDLIDAHGPLTVEPTHSPDPSRCTSDTATSPEAQSSRPERLMQLDRSPRYEY